MATHIYPEHIISSYILRKAMLGETNIDSEEAASVIPELVKDKTIKLMRTSYRSTVIDNYSPEFRSYFVFLHDAELLAPGFSQTSILPEGIKYAAQVMRELRREDQDAPGRLEQALKRIDKTPRRKRIVA